MNADARRAAEQGHILSGPNKNVGVILIFLNYPASDILDVRSQCQCRRSDECGCADQSGTNE